jgi:hypothetical protein
MHRSQGLPGRLLVGSKRSLQRLRAKNKTGGSVSSKPLQRSISKAKRAGYDTWIVERFIPFPKPWGHRLDLYNLIDLVAIRADTRGVLGIQACASGDLADHRAKALANTHLSIWKANGNRFCIWSWGKRGERGKRKLWTCTETEF